MNVKKTMLLAAIAIFIISIAASTSFATEGPLKKLSRGVANCFTFPVEIPNQIFKVYDSDGPVGAFSYGVIKGVGRSILRAVIGVYEVGTFILPLPADYRPILTNPEFIMEDWHA